MVQGRRSCEALEGISEHQYAIDESEKMQEAKACMPEIAGDTAGRSLPLIGVRCCACGGYRTRLRCMKSSSLEPHARRLAVP